MTIKCNFNGAIICSIVFVGFAKTKDEKDD